MLTANVRMNQYERGSDFKLKRENNVNETEANAVKSLVARTLSGYWTNRKIPEQSWAVISHTRESARGLLCFCFYDVINSCFAPNSWIEILMIRPKKQLTSYYIYARS